jgi:hypothetical protein
VLSNFPQHSTLRSGLLSLLLAGAGSPSLVQYQSNSSTQRDFVIVAHQDDWQLFMGDVVMDRIRAGDSVTFIYLTAGDDGRDSLYWQTRERAALQSVRLASGLGAADPGDAGCSESWVNDHAVRKCVVAKTVSFYLRLPDGKRNGAGFARHAYQSLRKLRTKKIAAITAVDGSATYRGWTDLVSTVGELIEADSGGSDIAVHSSDPSITINPHDHFDHRITGLLVEDLRKKLGLNTRYYLGYALGTRAANRSTDEAREKAAIFLAYDREMMRVNKTWGAYEEHPAFYSQCMVRTYARTAHRAR